MQTTHRITIDIIGPAPVAQDIRNEVIALLDSLRPLDAAYQVGAVQSPKTTNQKEPHGLGIRK